MGYIHFFDDWKLMSYSNLVRKQGQPRFVPEATLVDGLTEGTWNFPFVHYDQVKEKYIAIYGGAASLAEFENIELPAGVEKNLKPRTQILCYAESADGVNWIRPDMTGKVSFDGPVFAKNQIFGHSSWVEGGPPSYDPFDPDPNKRFKLLINIKKDKDDERPIRGLAVSSDGIQWKIWKLFESLTATDTPTSVFYNPQKRQYVLNVRKWSGDRRVFFMYTEDWQHFSDPELIMHPSPNDEPLVGFYGMPVYHYEDLYLGLLWKIYCDPTTKQLPNGKINCHLAYSYDGTHFNRTYAQPFIDTNLLGEHGGGCLYVGTMLVTPENKIRFYSGGSKAEHFQNQNLDDAALIMHEMRLDGFMYFATPSGKGTLRTRPLYITGDDLKINAKSPWGYIKARILDEKGDVLPGYDFDDCLPLVGDELFWQPVWRSGKTFAGAKSHLRRQIEIEIYTGEVYAIRGDFKMLDCLWSKDVQ